VAIILAAIDRADSERMTLSHAPLHHKNVSQLQAELSTPDLFSF